jgi:hypothetical protein
VHAIVWPQPSVTVPQSVVAAVGLQVSVAQRPASAATPPASAGTHALSMQAWPAAHPPQLIATPHASVPTAPHLPAHAFGWQLCDVGSFASATQTSPLAHAVPHAKTLPVQGSV